MRFIFLISVIVIISGCTANKPKDSHLPSLAEVPIELMVEKMNEKGEYLICSGTEYLEAIQISKEQCLTELTDIKATCLDKYKSVIPHIKQNKKEFYNYFQLTWKCMSYTHIMELHSDRSAAVAEALNDGKVYRPRKMIWSMLEPYSAEDTKP